MTFYKTWKITSLLADYQMKFYKTWKMTWLLADYQMDHAWFSNSKYSIPFN
jgi:hypothetical protein